MSLYREKFFDKFTQPIKAKLWIIIITNIIIIPNEVYYIYNYQMKFRLLIIIMIIF
jgi:hypothetical protein